jgi:alcohol dehydrogenase class IV
VTAPAAFRFLEDAAPERCARAASLLDGGDELAASLEELMHAVGAPTSLGELGYGDDDLATIVRGALDQRRLLVGSPKEVGATELEAILRASL